MIDEIKDLNKDLIRNPANYIEMVGLRKLVADEVSKHEPEVSSESVMKYLSCGTERYSTIVLDGVNNTLIIYSEKFWYCLDKFYIYNDWCVLGVGYKLNGDQIEEFLNNGEIDEDETYVLISDE